MTDEKRDDAAGQNETPSRERQSASEVGVTGGAKKSQIQQIAEGSSVTRRRYGIKSQPFGPQPATTTPNAAKLSSVASSSPEKFNGGRD
ncbi:MAG TPA: hypothetical protein VNM92_12275 [Thermoanaerobaculia bacterium]|nr:hypothetical protein [Thermoanaerobaculia bacterium]